LALAKGMLRRIRCVFQSERDCAGAALCALTGIAPAGRLHRKGTTGAPTAVQRRLGGPRRPRHHIAKHTPPPPFAENRILIGENGAPGGIRTPGLLVRRLLYENLNHCASVAYRGGCAFQPSHWYPLVPRDLLQVLALNGREVFARSYLGDFASRVRFTVRSSIIVRSPKGVFDQKRPIPPDTVGE
jgi:hypothetical protein